MIGIIISGHGTFAEGIYSTVKLIVGEQPNIEIVNFLEDDNSESLQQKIEKAIEKIGEQNGIVCFTDLVGGTPFKVCSTIAATNENIRVIGGTNIPMLLSSIFFREKILDEFVSASIEQGVNNIKTFRMNTINKNCEEGI